MEIRWPFTMISVTWALRGRALQFSVPYILIAAFSSASSAHILLIAATARR
jgi:hypothetical protein